MQLFPNIGSIILRPGCVRLGPNAESRGPNSPEWKSSNIAAIAFFYSAITSTFYQTLAIAACRFLWPRSRPLACMGYGVDGVQASSRPFSANVVQIHFAARLHSLRSRTIMQCSTLPLEPTCTVRPLKIDMRDWWCQSSNSTPKFNLVNFWICRQQASIGPQKARTPALAISS